MTACAFWLCFLGFYAEGSLDYIYPGTGEPRVMDRDRRVFNSPYGTVSVGAGWQIRQALQVELSLDHRSSIQWRDRGEDMARLRVRYWFPRDSQ